MNAPKKSPLPWSLVIISLFVLMCLCSMSMDLIWKSSPKAVEVQEVYVKPWDVESDTWKPVESIQREPVLQSTVNPVLFTRGERVRQ